MMTLVGTVNGLTELIEVRMRLTESMVRMELRRLNELSRYEYVLEKHCIGWSLSDCSHQYGLIMGSLREVECSILAIIQFIKSEGYCVDKVTLYAR